MAAKKVKIKIVSAVVVNGKIRKPKTEIEVDEPVAKNLFEREKAVLATASKSTDSDQAKKAETAKAAK